MYPEPSHISVFKINPNAITPTKAYKTDAGYDLYAIQDEFIPANITKKIEIGLAIKVPEGFVGLICGRGSVSSQGVDVVGGVVDASFAGSIKVNLFNSGTVWGDGRYNIRAGDKIAQILFVPILSPNLVEVNQIWSSERGTNEYGSSGK